MDPTQFNTLRYVRAYDDFENDPRVQTIVRMAGAGRTVLDLGCLDGSMGALLMRGGNTVHGIDASAAAVPAAVARGVRARVGNLEDGIDEPDGMFDVVVAGEIIEHIYAVDRFLDECARVLKPGGFLVLSTPNLAALGRRLLLLFNRNPHIEISFTGRAAGHIRYFVRHTLFDLLRAHGFRIVEFTSDTVNLSRSGRPAIRWLARACPTLGRSLIVKAQAHGGGAPA